MRKIVGQSFKPNMSSVHQREMGMPTRVTSEIESEKAIARSRNEIALEQARAAGLLGPAKKARLSGRVSSELIAAAKKRAHVTSDTELLKLALCRLALEDDFGARIVRRKGSIPADADLSIWSQGDCDCSSCTRHAAD